MQNALPSRHGLSPCPRARRLGFALALTAALLVLAGCSRPSVKQPVELTFSVAASLGDVMTEAAAGFHQAHPDVTVRLNLGSSGALANQITQGAPADLLAFAGTSPVDRLVSGGLVDGASVRPLAHNVLVLIAPAQGRPLHGWEDLRDPGLRHLAIANPAHVPAGEYSQATLSSLGLWDAVQSRLVLGGDVRQTLQFVESGEADAGLVYSTDAATSEKVRIVAKAPAGSHPPITYPLAVVKSSSHPAEAQAFAEYLLSPQVTDMLKQAGFEVDR